MPDIHLDYHTPTSPARAQRLAAALNRISWMLLLACVLALIAALGMGLILPGKRDARYISECVNLCCPILNLLGGLSGLASLLLKDRWLPGIAFLLHVLGFLVLGTSIGQA